MKVIDGKTLDLLTHEASESSRLRKNLNLHDDYEDPCQRLFHAIEQGNYIRPHRHLDPPKPECFMAIRGKIALIVFTDDGQVDRVFAFGEGGSVEVAHALALEACDRATEARVIREAARTRIMNTALQIRDEKLQLSYLENVPAHRELMRS